MRSKQFLGHLVDIFDMQYSSKMYIDSENLAAKIEKIMCKIPL